MGNAQSSDHSPLLAYVFWIFGFIGLHRFTSADLSLGPYGH